MIHFSHTTAASIEFNVIVLPVRLVLASFTPMPRLRGAEAQESPSSTAQDNRHQWKMERRRQAALTEAGEPISSSASGEAFGRTTLEIRDLSKPHFKNLLTVPCTDGVFANTGG